MLPGRHCATTRTSSASSRTTTCATSCAARSSRRKKAYGRIDSKGPQKALEDKKVQRDLKHAAESLKSAADALREPPKRKRGFGRVILLALVGAGLALALSEDLRKKALDALFGAEEEYEYTATTTPSPAAAPETATAS